MNNSKQTNSSQLNIKLQAEMGDRDGVPIFAAKLTPHRSLGRRGFYWLMGFVVLSCLIPAILFVIVGAWPVFIFLGADVLLVWVAFQLNYRAARKYEEIEIWADLLQIRKVSPAGDTHEYSFNPFWAKFETVRDSDDYISTMLVKESEREIFVGSFLNPDDRESFSKAFSDALQSARKSWN